MKLYQSIIVFSSDEFKTPLENAKTTAVCWWDALNKRGKFKALEKHFNGNIPSDYFIDWNDLLQMYNSVHHRN